MVWIEREGFLVAFETRTLPFGCFCGNDSSDSTQDFSSIMGQKLLERIRREIAVYFGKHSWLRAV